jgi:ferritin
MAKKETVRKKSRDAAPGLRLASAELAAAMNAQVGNEMLASLQYVSIATYFDAESLPELAAYFYRQAEEERAHAMKFVHFLVDAGARVAIPAMPAPRSDIGSAEEAVGLSLDWEQTVTQQIYDLVEIARGDRNYIALRFLDWFVTEQLEELTSMGTLLALVRRAGSNLFHVEEYLARKGGVLVDAPAGEAEGGKE